MSCIYFNVFNNYKLLRNIMSPSCLLYSAKLKLSVVNYVNVNVIVCIYINKEIFLNNN